MSADQNIAYVSAISLLELYRKRALSPVEATRILLENPSGVGSAGMRSGGSTASR